MIRGVEFIYHLLEEIVVSEEIFFRSILTFGIRNMPFFFIYLFITLFKSFESKL